MMLISLRDSMKAYAKYVILCLLLILFLRELSGQNYLLYHVITEMFSVVVACCIFIIAWNSRKFTKNSYLTIIGVAYLTVGIFDTIHTISYRGMGVFAEDSTNLPTQLWIAARYIESISLLAVPLIVGRRIRESFIITLYSVVALAVLFCVFYCGTFPVCYIDDVGLTSFKKSSECAISLTLAVSLILLYLERKNFHKGVLHLLMASIAVSIVTEMVFIFSKDVYGDANFLGHLLKVLSFYLIYKAIVQVGIVDPYKLIFDDLQKARAQQQEAIGDLEDIVNHRTAELKKSKDELRSLALKLFGAQEEERRRLAREMHDDLTQRLGFLAIEVGKVERMTKSHSDSTVSAELAKIKNEITVLSGVIHSMSRQLHPAILEELGLVEAVKSECRSRSQQYENVSISCVIDSIPGTLTQNESI